MERAVSGYGLSPSNEDLAAFKRIAAHERAEAVKSIGHAITAWLRRGLQLRYSDDAVTHPAAGSTCGC